MPKSCVSIKKINSQEVLFDLVEKLKQEYVLLKFKHYYFATTSFDSWMLKGTHVFGLVISFLNED
jgi:hypothetical protein